jgi:hypothetical protein
MILVGLFFIAAMLAGVTLLILIPLQTNSSPRSARFIREKKVRHSAERQKVMKANGSRKKALKGAQPEISIIQAPPKPKSNTLHWQTQARLSHKPRSKRA